MLYLLLFCHLVCAQEPQRVPFRWSIPQKQVELLSPQARALVTQIAALGSSSLSYYKHYPLTLPKTLFADKQFNNGLIAQHHLHLLPLNAAETERSSLAFGKNGKRKRLSKTQRQQIRTTGELTVASLKFAPQTHRWKLHPILQKGTHNSLKTFYQDIGWSLERVLISTPERLTSSDSFSMRQGLNQTKKGLRASLSQFIGLSEREAAEWTKEEWIETENQNLILRKQTAFLQNNAPLDARLLSREQKKKLYPLLRQIDQQVMASWRQEASAIQLALWEQSHKHSLSPKQHQIVVFNQSQKLIQQRLHEALRNDRQLQKIFPNHAAIGNQLAGLLQAINIRKLAHYRHEHDVKIFQQELTTELRKKHPVRASAEAWIELQSEKKVPVFRKTNHQKWQQKRRANLQKQGLQKQLELVKIELAHPLPTTPIEHQHWQQNWQARQPPKAARKFIIRRTLWKKQGIYVPANTPAEKGRFVLQHKVNYTLDSTTPFWRLQLLGARSFIWSNNALRWGFIDRIWNGRFGLRAQFGDLFGHRQFITQQTIDPTTGQISTAPNGRLYYSYGQRLGAVWTRLKKRRRHFEAQPDEKFLPKDFTRLLHVGWNYGVRGPVETVLIAAGQPVLTGLNIGFSGSVALSSVVWAPTLQVTAYGNNLLLFDLYSPGETLAFGDHPQFLPLPRLLLHTTIAGGAQTIGAATWGLAGEPLVTGGGLLTASTRLVTRNLYDALTYSMVIHPLGRVPAKESLLVNHISGPGIARREFVHLDSSLALLALVAKLEQEEMSQFQKFHAREISAPLQEYHRFLASMLSPFTSSFTSTQPTLEQTKKQQLKELNSQTKKRIEKLQTLLSIPMKNRIRQVAQERNKTILLGALLTEKYYHQKIFPRMSKKQQNSFWMKQKLAPQDWPALTEKLLQEAFSPDFTRPIETFDEAYVVNVTNPKLGQYIQELIQSIPNELRKNKQVQFHFTAPDATFIQPNPIVGMDDLIEEIDRFTTEETL